MIKLGCIADDFTGAGDIASFLVKGGMRTRLFCGIPGDAAFAYAGQIDAVVIALKTRTQETAQAVKISLDAVKWLESIGCEHYYIKYCSTFDSTKQGNIGPVCDAVLEYLQEQKTILCPALPENGRTVRDGMLYVNGVLLHESSMKNHPLTPMWDSDLVNLMQEQSCYACMKIGKRLSWQSDLTGSDLPVYLIPDCENEEDTEAIANAFGDFRLLTGGSGLAEPLAKYWMKKENIPAQEQSVKIEADGAALILAGSCSAATRSQIADFQERGGFSIHITPDAMHDSGWNVQPIWDCIEKELEKRDVLVYSSDTPDNVRSAQTNDNEISEKLEKLMGEIARKAVDSGVRKIIAAGGETSGAITKKLGIRSFMIGESAAPGVPFMIPDQFPDTRFVLKSGNFGSKNFFSETIERLNGKQEKLKQAIWVAHKLFERKCVTGNSGNISIRLGMQIYMSASGSCFGTLDETSFSVLDLDGNHVLGPAASKEWPLHLMVYQALPNVNAVIHTHSIYSVLWSCLPHEKETDCVPDHTPYLKMKLGTVGLIPYKKPGSDELFQAFSERLRLSDGWLLARHGVVVPGKNVMDAFYSLEELEESSRIAWELKHMA